MLSWNFALILLGVGWLAWSNGANDNFKGVATLYGSGTLSYRAALWLATATTLAGSLVSLLLAQSLVQAFSGSSLISAGSLDDAMLAAMGIGAGATVWLATRLGMPTSTTHALTGALVGAALVVDGAGVNWSTLASKFAQPLLLSPLLAMALTLLLYPLLRGLQRRLDLRATSCLCVGEVAPMAASAGGVTAFQTAPVASLAVGDLASCATHYSGSFIGLDARTAMNALHGLSAGSVCFARAVNDTPKITALLLAASVFNDQPQPAWALAVVAGVMALGGLIQSRRVAETLSRRITELDHGQGLTANLITAGLVLTASGVGLPVSTTHVSTGAIFAIGALNGKRNWPVIGHILLTWGATLPLGLLLGAVLSVLFRHLGV